VDPAHKGTNHSFYRIQSDTSLYCETTDTGLVYTECVLEWYALWVHSGRDGQAELTTVVGYVPKWFSVLKQ